MSKILDNIYVSVFLVNSESVLLLAFVEYRLYSHCTQNCIFLYFLEVQNLLKIAYLFCPKNSTIDFRKIFITQEWLVVESCPTPR